MSKSYTVNAFKYQVIVIWDTAPGRRPTATLHKPLNTGASPHTFLKLLDKADDDRRNKQSMDLQQWQNNTRWRHGWPTQNVFPVHASPTYRVFFKFSWSSLAGNACQSIRNKARQSHLIYKYRSRSTDSWPYHTQRIIKVFFHSRLWQYKYRLDHDAVPDVTAGVEEAAPTKIYEQGYGPIPACAKTQLNKTIKK